MRLKPIRPNLNQVTFADGTRVLVSYETAVAAHVPGYGYVKTETKHSSTTSAHISLWLEGANAETRPQEFFDNLMVGK